MRRHAGVIGDPVSHSLSPALHNAAYRALGLDITYGAFRVTRDGLREAVLGARALGFVGLSVTTPHKERVVGICDVTSPEVDQIAAANTVVFDEGVMVARTTDGAGLIDDLTTNAQFDPSGRTCAVLGAGGAARAVIVALVQARAATVLVVNRTQLSAEQAALAAGGSARVAAHVEIASADLVVNATSVALGSDSSESKDVGTALASGLHSAQLVYDLVYDPPRSAFLTEAARLGARTRNGLGMLVHQAAHQVKLFTNERPPLEVMWGAVSDTKRGEPDR